MNWLRRNFYRFWDKFFTYKTYLILISIIIGIIAAFAAVVLKNIVHLFHLIIHADWNIGSVSFLLILYPLVGIGLTVFYVKYVIKGDFQRGLSNLIYLLSRNKSEMPRQHMYSHLITSGLTVGFGGSVGLEAPIVVTGAAVGANTAKRFRILDQDRNLLIACGAAAGLSAIFNSPIAAIIFAFEVLLPQITVSSFIPLLISSASASIFYNLLFTEKLISYTALDWSLGHLPYIIILGVLLGLFSALTIKMVLIIENYFQKLKSITRLLGGGLLLGFLIFIFPPLFGEGYDVINALVNAHHEYLVKYSFYQDIVNQPYLFLIIILIIMFLKIIATSITIGAGGNGGVFAPSLFSGALAGFGFVYLLQLSGWVSLPINLFVVLGMAGLLSGVVGAPLTAIFLIAEITGGYTLFIPLMIISAIAFFIARLFEPYRIYSKLIPVVKGWNINDQDMALLDQIQLSELVEKDFITINTSDSFTVLKQKLYGSKHKFYPVVDDNNQFVGVIQFHELRDFFFTHSSEIDWHYLIKTPKFVADMQDNVNYVLKTMESKDLWNVPVAENGQYVGFVFRSRILNKYRTLLKQNKQYF